MPESRDRRITPIDLAQIFARRRHSFIYAHNPPVVPTPPRTAATGRGFARPHHAPGSENTPPVATTRRGRARVTPSRSVLPHWYPRTPLRDITAIVRVIERRRARLGEEDEGQRIGNTVGSDQVVLERAEDSASASNSSVKSPKSVGVKLQTPLGSKVPKIYLDISDLPESESENLTPQKKLLNNIDQVEEAVREELNKLKRTPTAKKAEREKRMRTLRSMR